MLVFELHPSQLLGGEGTRRQLATCLLGGGFNGEYEQAVAVSNDEDFAGVMPIPDTPEMSLTLYLSQKARKLPAYGPGGSSVGQPFTPTAFVSFFAAALRLRPFVEGASTGTPSPSSWRM